MGLSVQPDPPGLFWCPICGRPGSMCEALRRRGREKNRVSFVLSEMIEMLDRALQFDPLRHQSEDELRQSAAVALMGWRAAVESGDVERAAEFKGVFESADEKWKTRSAEKKKENPNLHLEF